MRPYPLAVLALALLGLLTVACGEDTTMTGRPTTPPGGAAGPDELFGPDTWELIGGTVDGDELQPLDDHPVTLSLDDGRIGGTAACNHYGGDIEVAAGTVRIGEMVQTEMACLDEGVMELEGAYLAALGRVTGGERDGEHLVLRGDDLELRFSSRPAVADVELAGTTWQLDTLVDGDAASSTVAGAEVTLEVAHGQLSGTTGCNRFWGPAEVVDGRLVAGPLATTRMACEGVMGQEAHAPAVLEGRPTIGIEGDRLTFSLDDGRSLVYRAR